MSKYVEDSHGNIYKKDAFGSHTDFWGNRYTLVKRGGGGIAGFIVCAVAVYSFFRDNPTVFVGTITLVLAIALYFIGLVAVKNGKVKAVLYSAAIYCSLLTLTSAGDIYAIYEDGLIYKAVLLASLILYMLVCISGKTKISIGFGIVIFILSAAYAFLVDSNFFGYEGMRRLSVPAFLDQYASQLEPLLLFMQHFGEYVLLVAMIIEMPLYFAVIRKRNAGKALGLSVFALVLGLFIGTYFYLYLEECVTRLRPFSFAYFFIPVSVLCIALIGIIRKLPRITPFIPVLIPLIIVSIPGGAGGYTVSELKWLLYNFDGYYIIAYILPVFFIGALFSHNAELRSAAKNIRADEVKEA